MALRCIPLFLRDTDRDVYFYFAGRPRSFRFTDQNSFQVSFDLVVPISMHDNLVWQLSEANKGTKVEISTSNHRPAACQTDVLTTTLLL